MKQYDSRFVDYETYLSHPRNLDFNNILKILDRHKPDRPTLFEFFMNDALYLKFSGWKEHKNDPVERCRMMIKAFKNAGYDYVTITGSEFGIKTYRRAEKTLSMNEGAVITNRESFEKFPWPEPDDYDYSRLETLSEDLPDGMKLIVSGPGGVQENVISLTGFDNLCYMLADDPRLVQDIFNAVGSRLARYYELCAPYVSVGALISNDDWGFSTNTMLSIRDLRKYVMPWHKRIVDIIHASGKPAILHSCGYLNAVMDDIIDRLKYDGKHSFEDKIIPVEQAYQKWGGRIAILGGIDLDFICRMPAEIVYERSVRMLESAESSGGYALGTGNSIPDFVPEQNYLAMNAAAIF